MRDLDRAIAAAEDALAEYLALPISAPQWELDVFADDLRRAIARLAEVARRR